MTVTTHHFGTALLPDGWADNVAVTIVDGTFARVERGVAPGPADTRHAIAVPGVPNVHSHAFQRGMAGLAETAGPGDDSFWTWREVMYRFVDRLTPDDLRAIAAMAQVEMLEGGFTRVGEFHYLHNDPGGIPYANPVAMTDAIVAACEETGIALTLLPVFYAHSGFGGAPPSHGQRRFVHDLDGFAALLDAGQNAIAVLPDAILGLAPHSLRAVTPGELAALVPMTRGPIHIHVAEQLREVEDCVAWSGTRPVTWLLDHAPVDDRWCLIHATHMTDDETRWLAGSDAVAGLCPITEANLGDGIFPARAFVSAGGRFGIGSDSNVLIDATEELRLLEYGQRLTAHGRNLLANGGSTGAALYTGALAGGAQALGVAHVIVVGASADFLTLDADHPAIAARRGDAILDGLVFAAGRSAIDTVWRRGARVVADGRHMARDAVAARYRTTLTRLLA